MVEIGATRGPGRILSYALVALVGRRELKVVSGRTARFLTKNLVDRFKLD